MHTSSRRSKSRSHASAYPLRQRRHRRPSPPQLPSPSASLCRRYKYHFRRTQIAYLLSTRLALHALTVLSFVAVTFVMGYVLKGAEWAFSDAEAERAWSSFWLPDLVHWAYGLSGVGLSGFISLLGGIGVRPLWWGWGTGGGGGGSRDSVTTVVLVIVIVVGLIRSFFLLYGWVEAWSQRALAGAEHMVENVAER